MSYCRFIAVAVAGVMFTGQLAQAQASGPAEVPPASFAENQYVDSRGCAFIRAGVSGNVVWVPRIGNDRRPICGLRPTGSAGTAVAAATPSEPATPPEAAAPAAQAQPRTATGPDAPINTVATTTTPPRVTTTQTTPAAPRTAAAAPAPAAPAAPAAAPAAAPEPRRVTLAEICEGRSGIQAGIIDGRTGQPVDCGGAQVAAVSAPAAAPAAPAAAAPAPRAGTGQPDVIMRMMTLADLCSESQGSGASYVNRDTGQPIDCGPVAPVAVAQAPVQAPARPAVQAPAPVAAAVAVSAPQQRSAPMQESFPPLALSQMAERVRQPTAAPMPETFPPLSMAQMAAQVNTPAPGYRPAFDDGRLNPERGIVPAASRPAIAGGHFVQVGTFGVAANADRAAARLESLGYSVAFQSVQRNGQPLRVVAAGPFATHAEAQAALRAARNAGYGDAFIR